MKRALLLAAALAAGCASDTIVLTPAPAAPRAGRLAFETAPGIHRSSDGRSFLLGAPASISGELVLPRRNGPFPAIVLAHGCNGNRNIERAWGPLLREWGYATFVIDSFGPRGIAEVCTNPRTLLPLQRVPET